MYVATAIFMTLAEIVAAGGKITKARWLSGLIFDNNQGRVRPGLTLSYMQATLPDGTLVGVKDAPEGLTCVKSTRSREMIDWAKRNNVYAKGAGLLTPEVHEVF